MTDNYRETYEYLRAQFLEVNGYEFYQELFPNNENYGEKHMDYSHPNAVYLYKNELDNGERLKLSRRVMLNDTWKQDYKEFVECNNMTLCSGLTYRRNVNKLENAQQMNALVFDLDGVGLNEMRNLFLRFGSEPNTFRSLPMPTYLVLSGSGLHVYYFFKEPIDLYPNIKLQLKSLKYVLTFRMWEYQATSQVEAIQYQSINQGFRMVGSINHKHGNNIIAFRVGEPVTLEYINGYVKKMEDRVDINLPFKPSKMTREEAKEAYPEWYHRVVESCNKGQIKWNIAGQKGHNGDELYNWWLSKADGIKGGHRYFFLMCLAIYACKCDIPKSRLKKDMKSAFDVLKKIEHLNSLQQTDIDTALEAYDKEYYNFTIADIEKLTDVRIERNRRNGRKQDEHLERARAVQRIDYPKGEWRNTDGRPSAQQLVEDYRKAHPEAIKADCIRATGLSKPTVYKYFDKNFYN